MNTLDSILATLSFSAAGSTFGSPSLLDTLKVNGQLMYYIKGNG